MKTQRLNAEFSGRSERSASISEDVVTTQVCARSRPEGRKIDIPTSLPPPPLPEKRLEEKFNLNTKIINFEKNSGEV